MALVFLPDRAALFLWGEALADDSVDGLAAMGRPASAPIVAPLHREPIRGRELPLLSSVARLATVSASEVSKLPASIACWCLASKVALSLAARERVVPLLEREGGAVTARWAAALSSPADAGIVRAIAASMPPSAHAVAAPGGAAREVWSPEALLRAFLDATLDALIRSYRTAPLSGQDGRPSLSIPWEVRWFSALRGDRRFAARRGEAQTLTAAIARWSEPLLGEQGSSSLRACFRLELPEGARSERFALRFLLQAPDDPSLLVTADEVWRTRGRSLAVLGRAFLDPQESLLGALARAARLFEPIGEALTEARPEEIRLDPQGAFAFLEEGAPALAEAGFGVIVPAELTRAGQRRIAVRMRIGSTRGRQSVGSAGFDLDAALTFEWEAVLGDSLLSSTELEALARCKAPLVRHRGAWVIVDPRELAGAGERLAARGTVPARDALRAALVGEIQHGGQTVAVRAAGAFASALDRLRSGASAPAEPPIGLSATLRPYQARGLGWLATLGSLGLGGCLADDMGLGKTVQTLAFLLRRLEDSPKDDRPALIVAPTSVLGNWEREARRFAPALAVVRHHGPGRATALADIPSAPGTLVVTSYGLLRQDKELLTSVRWSAVVLDEAQNIKNAESATAAAARALDAVHRFALTGTPVENRLVELWSILEFANPGLLGTVASFKQRYAIPIERHGDDERARDLQRITAPFVLRRRKQDPGILDELPPKNEMEVVCTLTREQATLYRAVLDEELRQIEESSGMVRRGRVLALLSFLKQVCNHPAQYLGESGPLVGRSGKLERLTEMLEEVLSVGDRALVFTQFREMGDRLVAHLSAALGIEVLFLHGGTRARARDEMIRRFQEPGGPAVFVLSVKAGGTGLNLTAASHVFHYDRWWNPAVEDQATDRAHRMGQLRSVSVHKLVCVGTMEERVADLLARKRTLAEKVVGAGEQWITELGDDELRDLFSLAPDVAIDDGVDAGPVAQPPAKARARRAQKRGAGR